MTGRYRDFLNPQRADCLGEMANRLELSELQELHMQLNCNTVDPSDGGDSWLDYDPQPEDTILHEIDVESFFFD